jgi:hypothetical protein
MVESDGELRAGEKVGDVDQIKVFAVPSVSAVNVMGVVEHKLMVESTFRIMDGYTVIVISAVSVN